MGIRRRVSIASLGALLLAAMFSFRGARSKPGASVLPEKPSGATLAARPAVNSTAESADAPDGRAWTAVLQQLSDPDPKVRLAALDRLEHLRPAAPDAIPVLNTCLHDSDPDVRAKAALQLGAYRMLAADAVPELKRLAFGDNNEIVRSRAKDALYNIRLYDYSPLMNEF